jgi:digeranylgeranylglycerophospholipid reductase
MLKNKYDVVIIGAGPSGSMACKKIAENNIDTLMIERKKRIGEPVNCAEGINIFLFKETGIKKDGSFICQKIDGTRIYFYDETYDLNSDQWKGYNIDRKIFDKYLAKQAEKKGAHILTNTKALGMKKIGKKWLIKIESGKKINEIEAKIVIGADGIGCNVGKWAGLKNKWSKNEIAKCLEYNISNALVLEKNRFHILFAEEFQNGYGWIFPKSNSCANVGVGIHPEYNTKNAISFLMTKYTGIDNIIKDISKEKYRISERRGGIVPICGPKNYKEIISDGVILAGDSAAIVDPITAEGIEPAMLSGIAAGETAVKSIQANKWNKEFLRIYDRNWRNKEYNGGSLLGEVFDEAATIRNYFYKVFTNKKISKKEREKLISNLN